ncbi:MAG: hypothetical protein ACYTGL_06265 [Planctomycetota bacterium]|jgi:hypothetical protein
MRRSLTFCFSVSVVFATSALFACSIPVFRYAFEQWNPDLFKVTVYHDGELSEPQRALLQKLQPIGLEAQYVGNFRVETVDLTSEEATRPEADWVDAVKSGVAWMTVGTPAKRAPSTEVVSAEFTLKNVELLLSSPQRKVVTDRLLRGESAVWVLLECGDREKDDAAAKVLTAELGRLEETLKLPEIEEKDLEDGLLSLDPAELKIRFSLVRIARDDAAEQAFVAMLRATEPDLNEPEIVEQPTALPVFGRGRSLWALVGQGINRDTIEDTCRFLTGACQCTVKVQNPGVDILTSVDWDTLVGSAPDSLQLERESSTDPPEYLAIAPGASDSSVDERATAEDVAASAPTESPPVGWLFGLGGFAIAVAGISLSSTRRGT